jgi:hypothetical protein
MSEMDATNTKLRKTWDRLVLLLISLPCEGWEHEFRQISRRKIYWLMLPDDNEAGHDE